MSLICLIFARCRFARYRFVRWRLRFVRYRYTFRPSKFFVCLQDVFKVCLEDVRSSWPEVLCKKRCSWKCHKILRKTPVTESLFLKSWSFFFYRTPPEAAFDVFKACLAVVFFKTSWKTKNCHTEDVFKTSWRSTNVCLVMKAFINLQVGYCPLDGWFMVGNWTIVKTISIDAP